MSELTFRLEAFEGPLDLLLHLISKHKLNIYDIEISLLLDQYLEYIDSLDEQDFDAAGDFLAMAARLVYIKTCSLLPQAEEAEEMKKELQGELIEYSVCKEAAARLRRDCVYGDVFVRPPEKLPVNMTFTGNMPAQALIDAYMGMTAKARKMRPIRAEQFSPIVAARIVTVTSKIVYVLKKLYKVGECTVEELYENVTDKSARVATFLAVLELAKSGRIYLNDENTLICFNRDTPRRHNKSFVEEQPHEPEITETEPEVIEPTPEIIESEPEVTESAPEITESEPEVTETTPEVIESETEVTETTPEIIESEPEITESEPEVTEPAPEPVYSDPEPAEPEAAEPEQDEPAAFREPVRAVKYALEPLSRTHSLAVPVYVEIPAEQPAPEPEPDSAGQLYSEPEPAAEVHITAAAEQISENENTEDTTVSYPAKENRFSARRWWGYPAQTSNCWSYWRERV